MSPAIVNGVNGVVEQSAFINHLVSYPVISDSINHIKQTPIGQKSITLTNATFQKVQPLLNPFYTPYAKITSYLTPYLTKADTLASAALDKLDATLPAVKKPSAELYSEGRDIVFSPLVKAGDGKDYVLRTYEIEIKKVGGEGLVTYGKAAITTSLIVGSDAVAWVASLAATKKGQAKTVVKEKSSEL